jgi:hypothetical protein
MIENYKKLAEGHWFQSVQTGASPDYKSDYSKNSYDTYGTNDVMSELRYNLIRNTIGNFDSICDYGYGNGAFMKHCVRQNKDVYGYDISDYPTPLGSIRTVIPDSLEVDVMTFFDSIEHLNQRNLVKFLKTKKVKHLVISVPWFHESLGSEWFRTWKHRRENEHFHHFDSSGLINLLIASNYKIQFVGNPEDVVRIPVDNYPNILTVIASKIQ